MPEKSRPMNKFEVVPAPSTTIGGKPNGGERIETTSKRFRIRNNHTLAVLPKIYDSEEKAKAECDRLEAE